MDKSGMMDRAREEYPELASKPRLPTRPTKEQIVRIAREYSVKGSKQLAQELNLTRSQVDTVVFSLRKRGVKIPIRKRSLPIDEALADIKDMML